MSDPNRGGQHPEFDLALRDNEVAIFCHDVLWPAINHLAGRDFIGEALPGSEIDFEVTNPTEGEGLSKIRITASIESPYNGEPDESTRVCQVSVSESFMRPDLLSELFKIASSEGLIDASKIKEAGARAWFTTTYYFEDEDFKTTRHEVHQLDTVGGSRIWDDFEASDNAPEDIVGACDELAEAEEELLDQIEDDIYSSVRREDIPEIRRMLGVLGVPSDILAA